ncbi:hypothetical protein GUJ93_ZPchr0012g22230 [Zizania palustris]|uniref:Uncharacterized protein n=1 Tax=Zizania palustris TaxID=103762 RepID=A0A8J6BZV8_ZIZPA|nr:hypothetical protein GUJ93_ZPchr0012g22230 [Zizania palustris]
MTNKVEVVAGVVYRGGAGPTSSTRPPQRYNERVVWNDKQLNVKLLRKGVLTRIYTPMAIVQGLRESGVFTSYIAAAQSLVNDKVSLKEKIVQDKNDTKLENVS